jgi:UDP-N-acetylglucosamine 2-epimerase (hydrolysing)
MTKRILFLTGTRADFGKLKPLMQAVANDTAFSSTIFATGMHTLARYGYTVEEIHKSGFRNLHVFMNQYHGEPMDLVLANTIGGLSRYVHEFQPDMLVVHGDRIEALAGATVGSLRNILVAHIEGGELSGTIDGLIRHAVSKLAHLHFVANDEAAARLRQMGEDPRSIHAIGSPDIDVMLSPELPGIDEVRRYYQIPFQEYGIVLFHPVTTELDQLAAQVDNLVGAILANGGNFVVVYPNNDEGCDHIFTAYARLNDNPRLRLLPSLRFESFLSLLKQAQFICGNSSAGIREAPVYGVPTINIGSRQQDRFQYRTIINAPAEKQALLEAMASASQMRSREPCHHFGRGDSAQRFMATIRDQSVWDTARQKPFFDLNPSRHGGG